MRWVTFKCRQSYFNWHLLSAVAISLNFKWRKNIHARRGASSLLTSVFAKIRPRISGSPVYFIFFSMHVCICKRWLGLSCLHLHHYLLFCMWKMFPSVIGSSRHRGPAWRRRVLSNLSAWQLINGNVFIDVLSRPKQGVNNPIVYSLAEGQPAFCRWRPKVPLRLDSKSI